MYVNTCRESSKRPEPGSSVVFSARTRGERHKLECRRLHLNIRKHFPTVGVIKHKNRLPRE